MRFFIVSFIFINSFAYAQTVEIKVTDYFSDSLINANVFIYSNSLGIAGEDITADARGKLRFNLKVPTLLDSVVVQADMYHIEVVRYLQVVGDTTLMVQMKSKSEQIEAVQVTVKGGVRLSNNTIVYYPQVSAFNKTRSVTELLPMIPNLAVRNGKYFFRNDGKFIILIDGVGENKTKEEQLQILENMPVDAIHRIEMIDNPSARYGDGVVAVINFMTKKDIAYTAVRGSVEKQIFDGGESSDNPNSSRISADSRFRLNESNLHFIAGLGDNCSLREVNIEQAFSDNMLKQREDMTRTEKSAYFAFLLDRKFGQRFSAQLNTSYMSSKNRNRGGSAINNVQNGNLVSDFSTSNSEELKNRRFTFNPQFKLELNNEKGTILYVNPTYAFVSFLENNTYRELNDNATALTNSSLLGMHTNIYYMDLLVDNAVNNKVLQTGFGYKINFLTNNQNEGGTFDYKEQQHTLFITNGIKIKKATLNADVRIEYLDYTAANIDTSANYKMFFFYPKVNLVYPLSEQKNLTVGYERQILRLGSLVLNPQTRYRGYQRGTSGNVDLQPRLTDHYFSRLYLNGHSITLNYKQHRNHRISVPINEEEPFIDEQTSYSYFRQFYVSYNKDFVVKNFWTANAGLYYYINRMESKDFNFVNSKGDNLMLDLSNALTLGKNSLNLTLSYMSTNYFVYGELRPQFYNSLNYSRLFFKEALSLSVSVNDFLGVTRENSYSYHPYISSAYEYLTNQRSLSLQLSYRFPVGKKSRNGKYKTDRQDEIRL